MQIKQLFLMFIVIFLIILIYFFYRNYNEKKEEKTENFSEEIADMSFKSLTNSVSDFIRENGFDSIKALISFVQGHYNEDIDDILEQKTLTLYYSAFSNNSLPQLQNRVWRNISPFFKDLTYDTSCKLLSYDNTHLEFSEIPYANKHIGVEMLSNRAYGPPSHLMGIQGNGTFTIFTVIKFNGFSQSNKIQNVFKIYGNTSGNNAITLNIEGILESKDAKMIHIIPRIYYGDNAEILINNNNGNDYFSLNMEKKYLLILSKKHRNISLHFNDLSKESFSNSNNKIIEDVEVSEVNVLFSNKQMTLNENGNLNANIYAFGIYNMYLMDETVLHKYMYHELYKSTENFMREARQILQFQNELEMLRSCPYDETVCKECKIDDWTDMDKIMYSSEECKKKIDDYCTNNPNNPKCKCWRNEYKNSPQCISYVNIFKNEKWVHPDHIENEMIENIKNKYGLCDCENIKKLEDQLKTSKEKLECQRKSIPLDNMLTSPHLNQYNIPSSNLSYEGNANQNQKDVKYLNESLDPYLVPGQNNNIDNNNQKDNLTFNDAIDPKYGEEIQTPSKGFWAWLFGQ